MSVFVLRLDTGCVWLLVVLTIGDQLAMSDSLAYGLLQWFGLAHRRFFDKVRVRVTVKVGVRVWVRVRVRIKAWG